MASRIVHPPIQIGDRFGRWTVLKTYIGKRGNSQKDIACCAAVCDCGKKVDKVYAYNLKRGLSKSCGCQRIENAVLATQKPQSVQIGQKFGMLTIAKVRREYFEKIKSNREVCDVVCDCGLERKSILTYWVRAGRQFSCGCFAGRRYPKEWQKTADIYHGAKQRCENINARDYRKYGKKGLVFGFESIQQFIHEIGIKPEGMDLDRIDNKKGYIPGNVRWATRKQNLQNTSRSFFWFIDGQKFESCLEAAIFAGVSKKTVIDRCDGYTTKAGNYVPPWPNYKREKKYK